MTEERLRELFLAFKHERREAEGTLEFDPGCPLCHTAAQRPPAEVMSEGPSADPAPERTGESASD